MVPILLPDGDVEEVTIVDAGHTPTLKQAGRYGEWTKVVVATSGEHDGEAYAEVRHYPTIVADVPGGHRGAAESTHAALSKTEKRPPLLIPVSSLGAVACDGHVGCTHPWELNETKAPHESEGPASRWANPFLMAGGSRGHPPYHDERRGLLWGHPSQSRDGGVIAGVKAPVKNSPRIATRVSRMVARER